MQSFSVNYLFTASVIVKLVTIIAYTNLIFETENKTSNFTH